MFQLSSSSTLFWRVFLAPFCLVAFGFLAVMVALSDDPVMFGFVGLPVKLFFAGIAFFVLFFVFRTGWKMRRVEANSEHLIVTDFWKTARYTWDSVEKIQPGHRLWVSVVDIWLHEPGVFGRRISMRPSKSNIRQFLDENPDLWPVFGHLKSIQKKK